jgi:hypothetical protein
VEHFHATFALRVAVHQSYQWMRQVASHSSVLRVSTIVLSERRRITAGDDALASEAVHIVQPDRLVIVSCTEEGIGKCLCGRLEAKIPAHDLCITDIPRVITYGAPCVVEEYFNPAFCCVISMDQSQVSHRSRSDCVSAHDASILIMAAVVVSQTRTGALKERRFRANTCHIVQPDWAYS